MLQEKFQKARTGETPIVFENIALSGKIMHAYFTDILKHFTHHVL